MLAVANLFAMCEICEERRPDAGTVILEGRLRVRCPQHRPLGTEPVSAEVIWDFINQPIEMRADQEAVIHRCVVLEADGKAATFQLNLVEEPLGRWRDGKCPHCETVFRSRHKFKPETAIFPVTTA